RPSTCIGGRVAGLAQRPSRGARKVGTATGCTRQVPSPAGIANRRLLAFPQIASCENWVTVVCDLPIGIVGTREFCGWRPEEVRNPAAQKDMIRADRLHPICP